MIEKVKMSIVVEYETKEFCSIVYDSIKLETMANPNDRATVNFVKQENKLRIGIDAKDAVSARAAINSYLKWMNLSLNVAELVLNSEKTKKD